MKEVKIYTIVSDQLSPPITGESFCTDMVRHSDYAELDAKYAALAADNDKAMESLKQANAVVKLAHEKFSAMAAENTALKNQRSNSTNIVVASARTLAIRGRTISLRPQPPTRFWLRCGRRLTRKALTLLLTECWPHGMQDLSTTQQRTLRTSHE